MRKWGDSGISESDMAALDYSTPLVEADGKGVAVDTEGLVSGDAMGVRGKDGNYEVADWDYRGSKSKVDDDLPTEEEILARGTMSSLVHTEAKAEEKTSGWGSMFARLTGKKILTEEDLRPVLVEMEKHLMSKNVAKDIAEKLCDSVGAALVGKRLGGLTSMSLCIVRYLLTSSGIKSEVQTALSSSLTRVLTPKTSTDLLLEIQRKLTSPSATSLSNPNAPPDPYTLTFVGVNGVGKSTNLSKVCFWLLQNKMRVLIAACDTFRSGAVEQLRVHVKNLGALGDEMLGGEGSKKIELYERGYGKDAAGIAKDAIAYGELLSVIVDFTDHVCPCVAKENRFDVVLIDTAGRMQDNEPLMRALAKVSRGSNL
jgi:signal recognition particle receptor subunit alpha